MNKAVYRLMATEAPGLILVIAGMLGWRWGHAKGEHVPIAAWELACIVIGFVIMGLAVFHFQKTVKALGVTAKQTSGRI